MCRRCLLGFLLVVCLCLVADGGGLLVFVLLWVCCVGFGALCLLICGFVCWRFAGFVWVCC